MMEPTGQGWAQVAEFALAFLLSGLIGLERDWRQKDDGLPTYTVVGIGAALFMLISKNGITDVLAKGTVVLDPSRVAAQIVSGLGFIGAGVIFVHRGSVKEPDDRRGHLADHAASARPARPACPSSPPWPPRRTCC